MIYPASWLANLKHGKHASWGAMGWVAGLCLLGCACVWANIQHWVRGYDLDDLSIVMFFTVLFSGSLLTLGLYLKRFVLLRISSWMLVGLMILFTLGILIACITSILVNIPFLPEQIIGCTFTWLSMGLLPLKVSWAKLTRMGLQGLVIVGGIITIILGFEPFTPHAQNSMAQLIAILGFIALGLTFALIFKACVDHIKISNAQQESHFNYSQLRIQCPHCQTPQLLTEAGQSCLKCGLRFHFRITEPYCSKCDYLIIGQADSSCPECVQAITQQTPQPLPTV